MKHCSKLKARDISSCEISICETVQCDSPSNLCPKRHTSVSFGSLPTSCSTSEDDRIEVVADTDNNDNDDVFTGDASDHETCDTWTRPSLVLQPSTDSQDTQDTATTSETLATGRRVS